MFLTEKNDVSVVDVRKREAIFIQVISVHNER
jgi:hypothetical protein